MAVWVIVFPIWTVQEAGRTPWNKGVDISKQLRIQ